MDFCCHAATNVANGYIFLKKTFLCPQCAYTHNTKSPRAVSPKGRPRAHRVQKSNYAAVEALALSLVLALSATSEVLALSEALADSEVLADAEVLAGSEALVLAGSDTDVLDGAVEAGALEEEESVPQATRDSAISAATARTRTFFIVKTSIFSILYTASLPAPQSAAQGHL